MTLKDYVIDMLLEERSTIETLLNIDNQICQTSLKYEDLLNKIKNVESVLIENQEKSNFITDGDIDSVFFALNYVPYINKIHINRRFVAINKWLVERVKEYYDSQNIKIDFELDIEKGYRRYLLENYPIILIGYKEFVEGMTDVFDGKQIIKIERRNEIC